MAIPNGGVLDTYIGNAIMAIFGVPLPRKPSRIIIGEPTLRRLGHQFETQRVGEASLKGKDQMITVHWVISRRDHSANHIVREHSR